MQIALQRFVKWLLVRKGTMLFISQTALQDTICKSLRFAKEFVDLNKSQTASQVKICEGIRFANMRFFLLIVLWGQYKRYKRKITTAEMTMGQEHGKEHLFEHVDALLVSGFGWD
jgi:hypothetical protein